MTKLWISAALLFMSVALSASTGQAPDLSGRWTRESVGGDDAWGSPMQITQNGTDLTVQPASGTPRHYRLDGTETAKVFFVKGCFNQTRITKAVASQFTVTITTWLVVKPGCLHGEVDEEPLIAGTGPIEVRRVLGLRKPESITFISRRGDTLTVDSTRSSPGQPSVSATSTYRK